MHQTQALIVSCIDDRLRNALEMFIENELSLYAVALKLDNGGIKKIFEEGPVRDWIFENIQNVSEKNGAKRIVLINHTDCDAYGGSEAFASSEEEARQHELQLRHAVSAVHAKFTSLQVEAYLAIINPDKRVTFKKVI